jgi:hypothetical protein
MGWECSMHEPKIGMHIKFQKENQRDPNEIQQDV